MHAHTPVHENGAGNHHSVHRPRWVRQKGVRHHDSAARLGSNVPKRAPPHPVIIQRSLAASDIEVVDVLEAAVLTGVESRVYGRPCRDRIRRKRGLEATPHSTLHQASKRRQIIAPFLEEIRVERVNADNTES